MSPDMIPVRVNRALASMIGLEPEELLHGDGRVYVHPDDRPDALERS